MNNLNTSLPIFTGKNDPECFFVNTKYQFIDHRPE